MFDLGIQELVVIFIVALLVFGPKRLPELGKTLGKGILELRKAMEGIRDQVHAESEALSRQAEDTGEGAEKKAETVPEPLPPPPVEPPYGPEGDKSGVDAGTVRQQTDKIEQQERKEDRVDDR